MPTYRPKRRTAPRQEKDAQGRRLCRQCKAVVPKGRLSYCGDACAKAFAIAYFPQETRRVVRARDKGVCAKCGVDTELIQRIGRRLRALKDPCERRHAYGPGRELMRWFFGEVGFAGAFSEGDFWQADHIQECVRGGWGLGLENFRTLCTPCHKVETARLVRELSAERRPAPASLFDKEKS